MVVSAIQQILEGTNYDTLYHFTHYSSLLAIIKYNKFVLSQLPTNSFVGSWLHNISNIYPFEYYSPERLKNQFQGASAKDAHMKLRNDSKWNNQWHDIEYYNQAEESLESYDDSIYDITDLVKYIKRIDVFDSDEEDIKNLLKFSDILPQMN